MGGWVNLLEGDRKHMKIYLSCGGMGSYGKQQNYEEQDVRNGERNSWYGLPEWKDKINLKTKDLTKELQIAVVLLVTVAMELIVSGANNLNAVGCNNVMWSGALSSNMQDKCRL